MSSPDPVMHLVAGPNGAGKTTLVTRVLELVTGLPFINADVIAAAHWPNASEQNSYQAAQAAAGQRLQMIAAGESFIAETVFSHPSKLEVIQQAQTVGFSVDLHVVLVPEDLCVARVADRVRRGGHRLPEEMVRQGYRRLWTLVAQGRTMAERTQIYDNSRAASPLRLIARYENGEPVGEVRWPPWTPAELRG